jgi:predicted permease
MPQLVSDVRLAVRQVFRDRAFALFAVLVLALGIGSSCLMFSLVDVVLLRDLSFAEPDRLVWMYNARTERDRAPISVPDLDDYRRDASTLVGLAAFTNWTANLTGGGPPERLEGTRVAGNFFKLLGARPLLGRALLPEDERQQARVTVLTHRLWARRFGSDASILGRPILLNGEAYEVVGVLPPRFLFPFKDAELAVPLAVASDPRRGDRGANFLRVVARLAPGVTLPEAKANLDAIAHRLQRQYPEDDARKTGISLYPLHVEIVRDYRTLLWTLFGAVGILFAVGCLNLANLLLVRASSRQTEFAIRVSLGASASRLARQLLAEAVVLAVTGGILGTLLAWLGLWAWRAWGPADFPQIAVTDLSADALLFACGVSALGAIVCGAASAWFVARNGSGAGRTRSVTAGRRQLRVQRALVASEVASATLLLVALGLTSHGLSRLEAVEPGFSPDRALSLQLSLPLARYATRASLVSFGDAVANRLGAIPGVEAAGAVSLLPLSGLLSAVDIALPDRPAPPPDEVPQAHFRVATPGYFAAAGIPIVEGRAFTPHDREDRVTVAVVNRTLAERHWPAGRALGQSLDIVQSPRSIRLEIVGVVADVKQAGLDARPTADLYLPLAQMPVSQVPLLASRMYWVLRGRHDPAVLAQALRSVVAEVDSGVAASRAQTLGELWSSSLAPRRVSVELFQVFSLAALALCSLGVYGVAAFSARTRRRELAIRAALGATGTRLACSMLQVELLPVLAGLGLGLAGAFAGAPLIAATLFETNPRDILTFIQSAAVLLAVAVIASYIPVRRAARQNPAEVLHS